MTAKIRKVQCYSPMAGTWWILQIKFLFIWWTLPLCYPNKDSCCQMMRLADPDDLFDRPIKTVEDEKFITL